MGNFALRETWMRIYFFRDSWICIFPSSGIWFSIFFVICEIRFTFAWFFNHSLLAGLSRRGKMKLHFASSWETSASREFEPTTFAGIIFHFLKIFRVLKARKWHQTRWKTCPFDELAEGGLRTNHSDSNLEGLESAIMDKSRWTNLHVRCEYNLSCLTPPPLYSSRSPSVGVDYDIAPA